MNLEKEGNDLVVTWKGTGKRIESALISYNSHFHPSSFLDFYQFRLITFTILHNCCHMGGNHNAVNIKLSSPSTPSCITLASTTDVFRHDSYLGVNLYDEFVAGSRRGTSSVSSIFSNFIRGYLTNA